ncbi:hypothetical protein CWS02_13935 [Enterobacter sp. EA-1]|nr:hypothetical protein CWS02_13935 [Enterobacter sp. EA-1]
MRNPEQGVLTEEDLTALQAVLAQRDYQIVTDITEPEKPERVRRAGAKTVGGREYDTRAGARGKNMAAVTT